MARRRPIRRLAPVISLIQRVRRASVVIDGDVVGAIDRGLLVFVGVERGDTAVTFGTVVRVLSVLGLADDLDALAAADPVGRALQDAALPRRGRSA